VATAPANVDVWTRIKRLKGWRGALAVLTVAIGIPIVGDSLSATAFSTPGAPVEVAGEISVPTILGWELADEGAGFARWERGSHVILVGATDFTGTSLDLLTVLEGDLRKVSVTYADGDVTPTMIAGLPALAMREAFVASFRSQPGDGEPSGPAPPVEGLLAAAVSDGVGVTFVAFSPRRQFGLVADDVLATLGAIERIKP